VLLMAALVLMCAARPLDALSAGGPRALHCTASAVRDAPSRPAVQQIPNAAAAAASLSLLLAVVLPLEAVAEGAALATKSASEFSGSVEGFEDFAAQGGKMEANPSCFFNECKQQTTSCFTNPACLKGVTCLGNCRGEQLCATQCFARFGSAKLNDWLGCTLEDKECVTTGVKQDTSKYYANPPPAMKAFTPADLEGAWYKVSPPSPSTAIHRHPPPSTAFHRLPPPLPRLLRCSATTPSTTRTRARPTPSRKRQTAGLPTRSSSGYPSRKERAGARVS